VKIVNPAGDLSWVDKNRTRVIFANPGPFFGAKEKRVVLACGFGV
jgi:hypothetical protein